MAVLVTLLAVGALTTVEVFVAIGVSVGVALGISVHGLGRSPLTTALAAAALPLGSFGAVVAVAQSGGIFAGLTAVVTLTGIVVGISLVSLPAGPLRSDQSRLVAVSACLSLLLLGLATLLVSDVPDAATARAGLHLAAGPAGFAGLLAVAGGLTALALLFSPSPFAANLRGQPREQASTRKLPAGVVITVVLTALLAGLVLVGSAVPFVDGLVETVAASTLARGLVVAFAAGVACVWLVGLLASVVWATGRTPPAVPLALGALLGTGAVVVLDVAAGARYGLASGEVFVPTLVGVLAVGAIAAWRAWNASFDPAGRVHNSGRRRTRSGPSTASAGVSRVRTGSSSLELSTREGTFAHPRRLVPVGLVTAVVVLALGTDGGLALGQAGLLVGLAGALFVHTSLTRGLTAARDVGGAVATPTQFVWLGWTATLALVGLGVAVATLLLSGALGDLFSAPATVGVVAGLVAAVAGLRLLRRRADSL